MLDAAPVRAATLTINLVDGKYQPAANPNFAPDLVSNRVRFYGTVHEHPVPRKPWGRIDFPIIHNHIGGYRYTNPPSMTGWLYRQKHIAKLVLDVMRGR